MMAMGMPKAAVLGGPKKAAAKKAVKAVKAVKAAAKKLGKKK